MRNIYLPLLIALSPFLATAQLPATPVAQYPLNNNAVDIGVNLYNGALVAASGAVNRFGTANKATSFTAGVSTGTLPIALITAMANDFSIGFWFRTSITGPTGTQWFNGISLVDAEVGGATNDWGICLIDGGKVCFGIGSPDITIKSTVSTYNNNAWHFVTATRNRTAGTISLYVDGTLVASSGSTNTGLLNAPIVLGLGRSSAVATGSYTGLLDDILMYNRVLSGAEVSAAYANQSAVALPLTWLSFTGTTIGNNTTLQWEVEQSINNDYFEIEYSADGIHFASLGRVQDKDAVTVVSGKSTYRLSVPAAAGTKYFYRVKQVDTDGRFSMSKTIKLTVRNMAAGVYLQTNPVKDEMVLVNNGQLLIKRIVLTDINGRVIKDIPVNSNSVLVRTNTQNLLPGFYLLRISGSTGDSNISLIKQ